MDDGSWTCEHFSIANPVGSDRSDAVALLRRLADALEQQKDVFVLGLNWQNDIEEAELVPSVTIFLNKTSAEGFEARP